MTQSLIYDLSLDDLTGALRAWGEPAYRARQVWEWLYQHKVDDFAAMLNLPQALRERLAAEFRLQAFSLEAEQRSSDGQTVKRLWRLPDGQMIESVLMAYDDDRRTACISTQAGCAMGCSFCATGQMGFQRNLTRGEIVAQVAHFLRSLTQEDKRLTNIVLMGMGEPFHNYDNTLAAIQWMNQPDTFGIGARRFTISTVGIVPMIRRFTAENSQVNLAVSLHAADNELRSKLIPVNRKYPLEVLLQACRDYVDATRRRITFEWALIQDVNDSDEQAHKLAGLLRNLLCHVNLIPLNPIPDSPFQPTSNEATARFAQILRDAGVATTVRLRRGIEINAGCGQLRRAAIAKTDRG